MTPAERRLSDRVTNYLTNGGFFNPEHMDHAKVRDLLIELREALDEAETTCGECHKPMREHVVRHRLTAMGDEESYYCPDLERPAGGAGDGQTEPSRSTGPLPSLADLASFRSLATQAVNGWACHARSKREHDEISRLHAALDEHAARALFGYCAICYHQLDRCSHCDGKDATFVAVENVLAKHCRGYMDRQTTPGNIAELLDRILTGDAKKQIRIQELENALQAAGNEDAGAIQADPRD